MTPALAAERAGFSVIGSSPCCVEVEGRGDLDRLTASCKCLVKCGSYDCIVVILREGKQRTGYAIGTAGVQVSPLPPFGERKHVDRLGASGVAGVYFLPSRKHGKRWIARAWNGWKYVQIGTYDTPEQAERAREAFLMERKELA